MRELDWRHAWFAGRATTTIVLFRHANWREVVEFTAHCSTKWATFLLRLKDLLETGKGRPAPDDLRIGDFH